MGGPALATARVEVEDLRASYRRGLRSVAVLDGLSLTVEPGQVAAVLGPNGAGKTTLLHVLAGFKRPDRGRCAVGGQSPAQYRRRHGCGYLPESLVFPRAWTCRDVLARSADLSASPPERQAVFSRAVQRSGLDSAALGKRVLACSKGMRQRLGLAHALAGEPAVVVLDEPFSGLDAQARAALRDELRTARDRGAAVLFASHETAEAHRLADRVYILRAGRTRPWPSADAPTGLAELEAELLRNGQ